MIDTHHLTSYLKILSMEDDVKKNLSSYPPTCSLTFLFLSNKPPKKIALKAKNSWSTFIDSWRQNWRADLKGHVVQPPPQTLSLPSFVWIMSPPLVPNGMRHVNYNNSFRNTKQLLIWLGLSICVWERVLVVWFTPKIIIEDSVGSRDTGFKK